MHKPAPFQDVYRCMCVLKPRLSDIAFHCCVTAETQPHSSYPPATASLLQQYTCKSSCIKKLLSAAAAAAAAGHQALTEVMSGEALPLGQILLHHSLSGNPGVVSPRQPQHIVAAHSPPPHNSVLDGVGQGMAQMQGACHIGGWDDDHKRGLLTVQLRLEEARLFPPLIPALC